MLPITAPEQLASRAVFKSPAAFRTIAEVASELDLPAHVLRFWESKFPQIKPLKRRGGRRYYRPEDVALLRRIRGLLYTDGYTIKGVQRLLRESAARAAEQPAQTAATSSVSEPEPAVCEISGGEKQELRAVLSELQALRALLRDRGI
jgi:DNA-binding transcriptional MerR regulator